MSALSLPECRSALALQLWLRKENLNGLLVLCEMLIPFFGRDLVDVASRISDFKFLSISDEMQGKRRARKDIADSLSILKDQCVKLGWDRLEFAVNNVLRTVKTERNHATILTLLGQIELALIYECNHHVFYVLPERYRHLVEHWPGKVPFGPEVRSRFPRACIDIDNASRCLAFGMYTACVFHLMGVMQEGINAIAKDVGAQVVLTSTWENIIGKIECEITAKQAAMNKPHWKRVEPFYNEAVSDLRSIKNAWRNPTMHFTRAYDEREAEKIFERSESFMVHLSTRLRQAPAPR